ncbi:MULTISPECIES: site-specific integrase [Pseudomonas]|uniref:site-specific integrase n=1 Tax=Pseudomonas TaxID=286 RepID=UPI0015B0BD20|nr:MULTISPECIES: site-specific integrase [Pseudomonas]
MALKIKDYKAGDGSRFSLLIDTEDDGMPLYYPTAYVSMSLGSLMPNTRRANLYALKRVYDWANDKGIDLDRRFATKKLFTMPEVESLVQALSVNSKESDGTTIQGSKVNYHLDIVSTYFGWLFGNWITDSNADANRLLIERLQASLVARKRKGGSVARAKRRRIAKKLSDGADAALLELFAAFQPPDESTLGPNSQNRYLDANGKTISKFQYGVAYRNVLALRILYDLGMRIGELLGLRYSDFIPASGGETAYLRIERNHDDAFDRRMSQPVAKTLGRTLPLTPQLERMISEYLAQYRADIPNVGYGDNAFILVNHKRGVNQGREIEMSTFRSALAVITERDPRLKKVHPHLLRHHWNYRFSELAIREGLTDVQTRQRREHWMGWVEGSSSARDYDLRHIQESANKHGRLVASDTARSKSDRKRTTDA